MAERMYIASAVRGVLVVMGGMAGVAWASGGIGNAPGCVYRLLFQWSCVGDAECTDYTKCDGDDICDSTNPSLAVHSHCGTTEFVDRICERRVNGVPVQASCACAGGALQQIYVDGIRTLYAGPTLCR